MKLELYNTLSHKKEEFKPINSEAVRIYSCGPTVYNYAHIGNLRAYIFMDSLRRVLKYNGYKLKHVMNITDVGHLESDADEGEDKMIKASKRENKDPYEIANYYTQVFLNDLDSLNIDKPEIICKATDYINDMIKFVEEILDNGYAYETSKAVYFDISKLDKYPELSNNKLEDQMAGARVEIDDEKRSPYDFALFIKAPKEHLMKWETPWGLCYPGWHIECSTMSRKHLGEVFDIHTGGIDHIPTHHENEIAQCKGATGKIPAIIWMHCEFITINNGKMSKSLGNTYTLADLKEKGFLPMEYKLFCFSSHYRNKLNFTFENLEGVKIAYQRLKEGYKKHLESNKKANPLDILDFRNKFKEAINDDLNFPMAMGIVWEVIKLSLKSKEYADLLLEFDQVLGLNIDKDNKNEPDLPFEIKELVNLRKKARKLKNWSESDKLRDEIISKGYSINDTKDGMIVKKMRM